ncbi:hypothetical protein CWI39_0192p0010 [Hamiltosporidium magnivora]|uniref:Uncharacterized protein n=1 Tax=Hamiltosporidium magnivora TaxID=148818 RepID=A0A4Q9LJH8_9MICR|nr:hypothetical protein CWI39_0192p0010 [Hamiltosporidium magnivora]
MQLYSFTSYENLESFSINMRLRALISLEDNTKLNELYTEISLENGLDEVSTIILLKNISDDNKNF